MSPGSRRRLLGLGLTAGLSMGAFHHGTARAEAELAHAAEGAAATLELLGATERGRHELGVNGARFRMTWGSASESTDELLAALASRCDQATSTSWLPPLRATWSGKRGTWSTCVEPLVSPDLEGLTTALVDLGQSGDLSRLLAFEAVLLRPARRGTSLLALTPLGPLRFRELFPVKGDAPGADVDGLPRPPGQRLLSVAFDGRVLLAAYQSDSADLATFARLITAHGLTVERSEPASQAFFVRGRGRSFVVVAEPTGRGPFVVVARLPD